MSAQSESGPRNADEITCILDQIRDKTGCRRRVQAASKIPEDRASIHTGPGKNSTWQRRLTLLAMCIVQGMILLDVTIVNIALRGRRAC